MEEILLLNIKNGKWGSGRMKITFCEGKAGEIVFCHCFRPSGSSNASSALIGEDLDRVVIYQAVTHL